MSFYKKTPFLELLETPADVSRFDFILLIIE